MIDERFGNWFAGICDGEGSFSVYHSWYNLANRKKGIYYYPIFTLHLRLDDLPMLEYAKNNLKCGKISFDKGHQKYGYMENPNASYLVSNAVDLLKIIEILDVCPLRSKKAREYIIWKQCVHLKLHKENAKNPYWEYACEELKRLKKYNAPDTSDIPFFNPKEDKQIRFTV